MSHTIFVLILSMVLGTVQAPSITVEPLSSHYSYNGCQRALQDELDRVGELPPHIKITCLEVKGGLSW